MSSRQLRVAIHHRRLLARTAQVQSACDDRTFNSPKVGRHPSSQQSRLVSLAGDQQHHDNAMRLVHAVRVREK